MKHLNKYCGLIIVSIALFYFCCLIDWKNEENKTYHPLEVIDNEIRVKETKEVLYRFIPVDGGEMEFDYLDKLVFNTDTIELHNSFKKDINSFLMGETPVTHRLWNYVMNESSRKESIERDMQNFFVYYKGLVSPWGWKVFIDSLENLTGHRFALPSSFQWEYAARGGNKSKNYVYSGSDNIDDVAMYNASKRMGKTKIISTGKQKKNNELGFYDMSGSIWELTTTKFGDIFPYKKMFETEDEIYLMGISRGGDINSSANKCSVKYIDVDTFRYYTGARLILVTDNYTIPPIYYEQNVYIDFQTKDNVKKSVKMSLQHIESDGNKTNQKKD